MPTPWRSSPSWLNNCLYHAGSVLRSLPAPVPTPLQGFKSTTSKGYRQFEFPQDGSTIKIHNPGFFMKVQHCPGVEEEEYWSAFRCRAQPLPGKLAASLPFRQGCVSKAAASATLITLTLVTSGKSAWCVRMRQTPTHNAGTCHPNTGHCGQWQAACRGGWHRNVCGRAAWPVRADCIW